MLLTNQMWASPTPPPMFDAFRAVETRPLVDELDWTVTTLEALVATGSDALPGNRPAH